MVTLTFKNTETGKTKIIGTTPDYQETLIHRVETGDHPGFQGSWVLVGSYVTPSAPSASSIPSTPSTPSISTPISEPAGNNPFNLPSDVWTGLTQQTSGRKIMVFYRTPSGKTEHMVTSDFGSIKPSDIPGEFISADFLTSPEEYAAKPDIPMGTVTYTTPPKDDYVTVYTLENKKILSTPSLKEQFISSGYIAPEEVTMSPPSDEREKKFFSLYPGYVEQAKTIGYGKAVGADVSAYENKLNEAYNIWAQDKDIYGNPIQQQTVDIVQWGREENRKLIQSGGGALWAAKTVSSAILHVADTGYWGDFFSGKGEEHLYREEYSTGQMVRQGQVFEAWKNIQILTYENIILPLAGGYAFSLAFPSLVGISKVGAATSKAGQMFVKGGQAFVVAGTSTAIGVAGGVTAAYESKGYLPKGSTASFAIGTSMQFGFMGLGAYGGKMDYPIYAEKIGNLQSNINIVLNQKIPKFKQISPVDFVKQKMNIFESRMNVQKYYTTPFTTTIRRTIFKTFPEMQKYYQPQLGMYERVQYEQGPINIWTKYRYRHGGYEQAPIRNIMTEANMFREPQELSFPNERIIFMPKEDLLLKPKIKMEEGKTIFDIEVVNKNMSIIGEVIKQQQIRQEPPLFETTIKGWNIQRQIHEEPVYRMFEKKIQSEYLGDKTFGDWIISQTRGQSETNIGDWGRIIDQDIPLFKKQQNVFVDITASRDVEAGTQFFKKTGNLNILAHTEAKETNILSISKYRTIDELYEGKIFSVGKITYEKPPKLDFGVGFDSSKEIMRDIDIFKPGGIGGLKETVNINREVYGIPSFSEYMGRGRISLRTGIETEYNMPISGYWKGIAPNIKTNISSISKTELASLTKTDLSSLTRTDLSSISKTDLSSLTRTDLSSISKTELASLTKTELIPILTPKTMQINIPILDIYWSIPQILGEPKIRIKPSIIIPGIDLPEHKKKGIQEQGQGYAVMVKDRVYIKGKRRYDDRFIKLFNQPLTKNDAMSLGATAVNESAAATFYIKPVEGKPKSLPFNVDPWGTLQNMFYPKNNKYIEITDFRINTPGEIKEISAKGWMAERRRQQPVYRPQKTTRISQKQYKTRETDIDNIFKKMFKNNWGDTFGF